MSDGVSLLMPMWFKKKLKAREDGWWAACGGVREVKGDGKIYAGEGVNKQLKSGAVSSEVFPEFLQS